MRRGRETGRSVGRCREGRAACRDPTQLAAPARPLLAGLGRHHELLGTVLAPAVRPLGPAAAAAVVPAAAVPAAAAILLHCR